MEKRRHFGKSLCSKCRGERNTKEEEMKRKGISTKEALI
jgi:hypothetical protein